MNALQKDIEKNNVSALAIEPALLEASAAPSKQPDTEYTNNITIITIGRKDAIKQAPDCDSTDHKALTTPLDTSDDKYKLIHAPIQKRGECTKTPSTHSRKIYAIGATSQIIDSTVIYSIFYYPTARDLVQSKQTDEIFFVIDQYNKNTIKSVLPTTVKPLPMDTDTMTLNASLIKTVIEKNLSHNVQAHSESSPILSQTIKHAVKKGDTLWGLASTYLNNPFKYPVATMGDVDT